MDQSSSIISNAGSALYITFYPSLHAYPTILPPRCVFVCANSLVVSPKAATAKVQYNLRVVEMLVGAQVLVRLLGISVGDRERITLREVLGRFVGDGQGGAMGSEELCKALGGEGVGGLEA